jgi:hypothetical protein
MKFLSLALLFLTALVGAQSASDIVNGLDGLTEFVRATPFDAGNVVSFSSGLNAITSKIEGFTEVSALGDSQINTRS